MGVELDSTIEVLRSFNVRKGESSISGLSSGAFMAVQVHLAHSKSFIGAGVIAGGPFRCAQSFRGAALIAGDAYAQGALYIGMAPLIPEMAPDVDYLVDLTNKTDNIDKPIDLKEHRVYIFTGKADKVVYSDVVAKTKEFYQKFGVKNIKYNDEYNAGHSIITNQPEHSKLDLNCPPYINNGGFMLSHEILKFIYDSPETPSRAATDEPLKGKLVRFEQKEVFSSCYKSPTRGGLSADQAWEYSSLSEFGYVYIPSGVLNGDKQARIHIVLHGCKQGYNYINFVNGRADAANQPPYGNRYITTTGYNAYAEANDIIVLYPQVEGRDNKFIQNPDGCWDWWGYSGAGDRDFEGDDYYSRGAIQVQAIHGMLERLGG